MKKLLTLATVAGLVLASSAALAAGTGAADGQPTTTHAKKSY